MFTMARIKAVRYKGKEFFLDHLSANDYYSEKKKITGVWHGNSADDFQLQNMPVTADVFKASLIFPVLRSLVRRRNAAKPLFTQKAQTFLPCHGVMK